MKCEGWARTPRTMCAASCADFKYSVATASSAATLDYGKQFFPFKSLIKFNYISD